MVRYVVVGGGVAGVCCVEELCRLCPRDTVTLVSPDKTLKGVSTIAEITKNLEELTVEEKDLDSLPYSNFEWVQGHASGIDIDKQLLVLTDGGTVAYDKICICAGAKPRRISNSQCELALRDTQSVQELCSRLPNARNVMIVGNGGIALELIHALAGYNVIWVMRHAHIGDAFFDVDAARFLLEQLQRDRDSIVDSQNAGSRKESSNGEKVDDTIVDTAIRKEPSVTIKKSAGIGVHSTAGHAVGPTWIQQLPDVHNSGSSAGGIILEHDCEVASIEDPPSNSSSTSLVSLTNGHKHNVDLILAAAGVVPTLDWVPSSIERAFDGGLRVNKHMQTSIENIYAAGDSCTIDWGDEKPHHWFQMRLWSQARATGVYAAHCMAGVQGETGSDMAFELFTHVTRFLGQKVIFLGLYNGQGLENEPHDDMVSYSRVTQEGQERTFVRVLLLRGRVQGAIMIGETDLEETFENLILDQLDIGQYGHHILDPDVELDHVFD